MVIYLLAMRVPLAALPVIALAIVSCGSQPKPVSSEPATKTESPKPADESTRFATTHLVKTEVVDKALLGKTFMPGGTLAHYKKGKKEYEMFAAKLASPTDAAILLLDWKNALADSKLIASFGGYFGTDNGKPVFVFSKGDWIAGISGLPEKEADLESRTLAAHLN